MGGYYFRQGKKHLYSLEQNDGLESKEQGQNLGNRAKENLKKVLGEGRGKGSGEALSGF